MSLTSCLAKPTKVIGFAGSMSGKDALMGIDGRDGALLAVDTVNATQGMLDYKLELIIKDDQGTPEGAQTADSQLIEAEVVGIIGHMTSTTALAGLAVTEPAGVVVISPTAATTSLSDQDDLFFRMFSGADIEAGLMARRISERGLKSVGIILDSDNSSYTESVRDAFKQEFEQLGGVIPAEVQFSSLDDPDFRPLLEEVRGSGAEALLIIAGAQDTGIICQHARILNWEAPLFTARWGSGETTIRDGGRAVDGLETIVDFNPNDSSPEYKDFLNRFRARFNREPTFAALRGYEAVLFLAAALEFTSGEEQDLRQALLAVGQMTGPAGKFHHNAYGDVIRSHYLLRVEDGAWVTAGTYQPEDVSLP